MKYFLFSLLFPVILMASAQDADIVYAKTEIIELFHMPYYVSTIIDLSPEALKHQAKWVVTCKDKGAVTLRRGTQGDLFASHAVDFSYDCRWSVVFKDSKSNVLAEASFDELGKGVFLGKPIVVQKALMEKLRLIAKSIDPEDAPRFTHSTE